MVDYILLICGLNIIYFYSTLCYNLCQNCLKLLRSKSFKNQKKKFYKLTLTKPQKSHKIIENIKRKVIYLLNHKQLFFLLYLNDRILILAFLFFYFVYYLQFGSCFNFFLVLVFCQLQSFHSRTGRYVRNHSTSSIQEQKKVKIKFSLHFTTN
jgi:hypothetical protein